MIKLYKILPILLILIVEIDMKYHHVTKDLHSVVPSHKFIYQVGGTFNIINLLFCQVKLYYSIFRGITKGTIPKLQMPSTFPILAM